MGLLKRHTCTDSLVVDVESNKVNEKCHAPEIKMMFCDIKIVDV